MVAPQLAREFSVVCAEFGVAGHDRGSYRAFRIAMDFPESVAGLVVMDGIPIYEV